LSPSSVMPASSVVQPGFLDIKGCKEIVLWDFRSQQFCWRFKSSGVLCYVAGFVVCDVSKECGSSIVRFKKSQNPAWTAWPWMWVLCDHSKHQVLGIEWQNVTFQKPWTFNFMLYFLQETPYSNFHNISCVLAAVLMYLLHV
jgi:hypothetical protein